MLQTTSISLNFTKYSADYYTADKFKKMTATTLFFPTLFIKVLTAEGFKGTDNLDWSAGAVDCVKFTPESFLSYR